MQDTLSSLGCLVDDEIVLRAARVLAPSSADCTGWRALTQVPREQGGEGGAAGETMPTSAPANVAPPQAHADRAALLLVVTGIGPDRNHTCPTCCDLDPVRGFGRPHSQKHPDIGRASTHAVCEARCSTLPAHCAFACGGERDNLNATRPASAWPNAAPGEGADIGGEVGGGRGGCSTSRIQKKKRPDNER